MWMFLIGLFVGFNCGFVFAGFLDAGKVSGLYDRITELEAQVRGRRRVD